MNVILIDADGCVTRQNRTLRSIARKITYIILFNVGLCTRAGAIKDRRRLRTSSSNNGGSIYSKLSVAGWKNSYYAIFSGRNDLNYFILLCFQRFRQIVYTDSRKKFIDIHYLTNTTIK